jgi:hypothetical protein
VIAQGGRADEWKFTTTMPAALAGLDEAAGFRRENLAVRTLWIGPTSPGRRIPD